MATPADYAAWLASTPRSYWTPTLLAEHMGAAFPAREPPPGVTVAGLDRYRRWSDDALGRLSDAAPGRPSDWDAILDAWVYGMCTSPALCDEPAPRPIVPLLAEGWVLQRAIKVGHKARREAWRKLWSDVRESGVGVVRTGLGWLGAAALLAAAYLLTRRP